MNILSHRGFWRAEAEKNARAAFAATLSAGFGTETDVRDALGDLVVSHDPPSGAAMRWADLLDMFDGSGLPLAVNVKADGLCTALAQAFDGRAIDWFAFDMSAPETVRYMRAGLPYYTRHSDVEPDPILYDDAKGVWLDSFNALWFGAQHIADHLARGKAVCVVSEELHGREPAALWHMLKAMGPHKNLSLCTDRPDAAREYFQ
ncbi:MAG: phosphodiesterase [Methylovirgula sp.]